MKILGLIPARGGSKRLPGKNIRQLGNKPLIAWTIDFARACPEISEVVVSTDDREAAAIAEARNALVPGLRADHLAQDETTSMEVVSYELDRLGHMGMSFDAVLLLQPTTPFRRPARISQAVRMLAAEPDSPVVSVCEAANHPLWCVKIDANGRLVPYLSDAAPTRSQLLAPSYAYNGSIYLASIATLREYASFITPATRALVMDDPFESIDIDDAWDWRLAELVAASPYPSSLT